MAVTYEIQTLKYKTSLNGKSNVVDEVTYKASKTTGGVTATIIDFVNLDTSDLSSFTAYDSITKDQALGWVSSVLTTDEKTEQETRLDALIARKATPTEGAGTPWNDDTP